MSKIIYLDNNATTMVAPEVIKSVGRCLEKFYGNPSSLHILGVEAMQSLQKARKIIADSINADSTEIFFTASGSEGDNLCIKGFCEMNKSKGNHIITSAIEHPAVINTCKHLEEAGFNVTYLPVDKDGFVDPGDIERSITPQTILVSIMLVNNEIGTIQDISAISEVCRRHNVFLHTDAVQAYSKVPIDVKKINLALATFSGHKIHAPKGIGFIYKRKDVTIKRQVDGGGQEMGLRAGTENLPYIIGLAEAVRISSEKEVNKMKELQKYAIEKILEIPGARINGPIDLVKRVCNNINVAFNSIEGELILNELSEQGICVSTGSACSSRSARLSPVLKAIECPVEYVHGNIRISTSRYTTKKEIDVFLKKLKDIISKKSILQFSA